LFFYFFLVYINKMSSQTIYFTNPAVITNIQNDVDYVEETTHKIAGRQYDVVTNGGNFAVETTQRTYATGVWKTADKDLQNTRYIPPTEENTSSSYVPYSIKDYELSKSFQLPTEEGQTMYGLVVDEESVYALGHVSRCYSGAFIEGDASTLAGRRYMSANYLGGLFGHDANNFGYGAYIVKLDRYSLKQQAIKYISTIPDMQYSTSTRGPITIHGNYIYLALQAQSEKSAIVKLNKSDLSVAWTYTITGYDGNGRPYGKGVDLRDVRIIPAKGARTWDAVIVTSAQLNTYSPTSQAAPFVFISPGVFPSVQNARKLNPGWYQDCGRVFCLRDHSSSPTLEWTFNTTPDMLQAGDMLTSDSFIPTIDELFVRNNFIATASTGTWFQNGSGAAGIPDTRGRYYTGSDGSLYQGQEVMQSDYGFATYFVDFLDSDNYSQLINGTLNTSGRLSSTGVYRGYQMTGSNKDIIDRGVYVSITGSYITGESNASNVGGVSYGHPFIKTLFGSMTGTYALTQQDAYHLNYYGAGVYEPPCYDEVNDQLYISSSNSTLGPVMDSLVQENTPYVGGASDTGIAGMNGIIGKPVLPANLFVSLNNAYQASGTITTLNALYTGSKDWDNREYARLAVAGSPRSNRNLHGSITAIKVTDGEIKWSERLLGYSNYDWDQALGNFVYDTYMSRGQNADMGMITLVTGASLTTTGKRMVLCTSKLGQMFFDPDASVPVPPAHTNGNTNVKYPNGIAARIQSPLIRRDFWDMAGGGFSQWSNAACDGSNYIITHCYWTPNQADYQAPGAFTAPFPLLVNPTNAVSMSNIENIQLQQGWIAKYDITATGPLGNASYGYAYPQMTKQKVLAPESPLLNRCSVTLWENTAITTHSSLGAMIAHRIDTMEEVWRKYLGYNLTAPPVVVNEQLFPGSGRNLAFSNGYAPILRKGSNFVTMFTPQGM
jgi:hypothetical protein